MSVATWTPVQDGFEDVAEETSGFAAYVEAVRNRVNELVREGKALWETVEVDDLEVDFQVGLPVDLVASTYVD